MSITQRSALAGLMMLSDWNSSTLGAKDQDVSQVAKWTPSCADDARKRDMHARPVREHHQHNSDRFATLKAFSVTLISRGGISEGVLGSTTRPPKGMPEGPTTRKVWTEGQAKGPKNGKQARQ